MAYTTPGTYTFTVPTGVRKVRVSMSGGGGGGGGLYGNLVSVAYGNGGDGGASYFGTYLSAAGGVGGGNSERGIGRGKDVSGEIPSVFWGINGQPGQLNGYAGAGGAGYGGGGGGLCTSGYWRPGGITKAAGTGGSAGSNGTFTNVSGGGGGQWIVGRLVEVSANLSIPITVGAGGVWWDNQVRSGCGASGIVLIEWGGDIK